MRRPDLGYILAAVGAAAAAVFYCVPGWVHLTLPRYYPVQHEWRWGKTAGVPSQGWYGAQVFAFLAAAVVAGAVYLVLRRRCRAEAPGLSTGATAAIAVLAVLLILASMGYMLQHEFAKWGVW